MPGRAQQPTETRYCTRDGCGKPIERHRKEGIKTYSRRLFCSSRCASLVQHYQNGMAVITPEELRRRVLLGQSDVEIAKAVGVVADTIGKWRRKHGIPPAMRKPRDRGANRGMRGQAFKTAWSKVAEAHWRNRRFEQFGDVPKETVEDYLARGGKVTKCPAMCVADFSTRIHSKLKHPHRGAGQCR